ncbi:MAG: cation:proton antiporter [Rickettsiaceae bacterium]|nr:MAG: cation:proton antiporter [Rickettsiaceae bacterium]
MNTIIALKFYLILICFYLIIIMYVLVKQKSFISKIIVLNSLNSLAVLFIFTLGCFQGNKSYFDIALIYLIIGFVSNIGYFKYFQE